MDGTLTLPLRVRVDLGMIVIKLYFTLARSSQQEYHHQMQLSVIHRRPHFAEDVLPSERDTVNLFSMAELFTRLDIGRFFFFYLKYKS